MPLTITECVELLAPLERTRNYPRDERGVRALAEGLQRASELLRVSAKAIVQRCAETSEYCPSDADLVSVAREIRGAETWQQPKLSRCPKCHGIGYVVLYFLHTQDRNYKHKEPMTQEAYDAFFAQATRNPAQMAYDAVKRCSCGVRPSGPPERESA